MKKIVPRSFMYKYMFLLLSTIFGNIVSAKNVGKNFIVQNIYNLKKYKLAYSYRN